MLDYSGRKIARFMGCLLVIVLFFIVYDQRDYLWENPFLAGRTFEYPSFASTSANGTMLVVDQSKTRVTALNDNTVSATIRGGKTSNGFYYAEYAVTNDAKIYIADIEYAEASSSIKAERIMRYSLDGRFEAIVYEKLYADNMPLQYGNIRSLQVSGGTLSFLLLTEHSIDLYNIVQDNPSFIRSVGKGDALSIRQPHYDALSDRVLALTMRGDLYAEQNGLLALRESWADSTETVPWEVASDNAGNLYVTDLLTRSVLRLPDDTQIFRGQAIAYRLTVNEHNILSLTDTESVFQMSTGGELLFSSDQAAYSVSYFVLRLLIWAFGLLVAVSFLHWSVRFIVWLLGNSQSKQTKAIVLVGLCTVLTSAIVAFSILRTDAARINEKNKLHLTQIVTTLSDISRNSFGDALREINTLGDHGGEAYNLVRSYLEPPCRSAADQGSFMYYVAYKFTEDTFFGFIDYESAMYTIYPMGDIADTDFDDIARGRAPYIFTNTSDSTGSWTYALAPVYASDGSIVGILEYGLDSYGETLQNRRQVLNIILSTCTLLVLFMLLFSEAAATLECGTGIRAWRRDHTANVPELIRPFIFLTFFADNTSAAFFPQLSARIFGYSGFWFSESLGAAMPMTIKLFFVALVASLGGTLTAKLGMKRMLFAGVLTGTAGLALTSAAAATNHYGLLLVSECVRGCGLGTLAVSANMLPVTIEDEQRRNKLFSGVNVGILSGIVVGASVGSYIAQAFGYSLTFAFSAAVLLPSLLLAFVCAPAKMPVSTVPEAEEAGHAATPVWRFLADRSVFSLLLLLMFPFLAIMSFKDYVFPLFASLQGYSETSIGRMLLFSGAIAIFVTPALSAYAIKRLGAKRSHILAGALYVAGMLLFAVSTILPTSIFLLYLLYIAGGFGLVVQGIHFASLSASRHFGLQKAMSIHTLFDNLSKTAGPVLFGALISFGFKTAALVMAAASFLCLILFVILNRRSAKADVPAAHMEETPSEPRSAVRL